MDFRNELKYVVNETDLVLLENRLKGLIKPDEHVGADGLYHIRSLYFDDYYNSYYAENENGTDPREKFRIRIYNADSSVIHLELKKKEHGMTQKLICAITEEQCRTLMEGKPLPPDSSYPPVLQKLLILMRTRLLKPVTIVEYDRQPFASNLGNTRITFDRNIRSSDRTRMFLEEKIPMRPIMPAGQHILEVKYDEFLPDYLNRNMQLQKLRQTAYSKYYLCRRYSLSGIRC